MTRYFANVLGDQESSSEEGGGSGQEVNVQQGSGGTKAPFQKMTKTQLIRYMAEQMEVPPKQIAAFFDLLIETATTQTRKIGEFTIPGLGKLVKAQRAARMGRNPATGETIKIKAKTTVKFRLSKSAKDAVISPKP